MEKAKLEQIILDAKFKDEFIKPPEILVTIRDKIVLTQNSFMTISGLPKSRKTTFMNMFIASAFTGKSLCNIKVNLQPKDKIVVIDTEQNAFDFAKQIKHLKYQLGSKDLPANLLMYLFRPYDPDQILETIYLILEREKPKFIFIDNLTEMVSNPNDPVEAKKMVQVLKRLTQLYNCGIINILHLNKTNKLGIGHLGSYVDRGSQSVLTVENDKPSQTSTISSAIMRSDQDFDPVAIMFDPEMRGYTETDPPEKEETQTKTRKGKFTMADWTDDQHKANIQIAFQHQETHTYLSLVDMIRKPYGKGDTITRSIIIPYLVSKKWIGVENSLYTSQAVIKTNTPLMPSK